MKTYVVLLVLGAVAGFAATDLKVIHRFPVGGPVGGWDFITVDSEARRVYVSHATRVEVLDADSGETVGTIPDTPGVHGIAIAPNLKRGFTTNGKEDKVTIFDTTTLKVIRKIDVGKVPDPVYYDAGSGRVFTGNHGSNDITAIDAETGKVVGTANVKGTPEFMVTATDGSIYVNMEDTNEVVVFDPKSLEIQRRFPIVGGKTCTGLALDKANSRLFIGCRNQVLLVMDATEGKVIATFPIGTAVDGVEFDAERRLIYAATSDGVLTVIHQTSADGYEEVEPVKTQASGKTMALDLKTHNVLVPAAEMKDGLNAEPGKKVARIQKPDSLFVYVIGN